MSRDKHPDLIRQVVKRAIRPMRASDVLIAASITLATLIGMIFVSPAHAGAREVALLANYVGEWGGSGVMQGGDVPEPFTCRLNIDKGNKSKINYAVAAHWRI